MWGDRKQRLSRMLYLRGARASLLISANVHQVPEGKSLLSFSSPMAPGVVISWWNRNPPGDFFDTDNQTCSLSLSLHRPSFQLVASAGNSPPSPLSSLITHKAGQPYFPLKVKFKCCFFWEVIPRVHSLLCTANMGITPGTGVTLSAPCLFIMCLFGASTAGYSSWHLPWQSTTA